MPFWMVAFTSVKDRTGLAIMAAVEMKAIKAPVLMAPKNAGDMAK